MRLTRTLQQAEVEYAYLPSTNDIWDRDFMPIQVARGQFVQFRYNPDYLQGIEWQGTISDVDAILKTLNITSQVSNLVLDGGNIIKGVNCAITCDKVFQENKNVPREMLISEPRRLLEVERIGFIPWHPDDPIGHADGMVRLINDATVLVNELRRERKGYREQMLEQLQATGFAIIELPYNPYNNKTYLDATGVYINYLHVGNKIIFGDFGLKEDNSAAEVVQAAFPNCQFWRVKCNEIAREGGILNCISWNIRI